MSTPVRIVAVIAVLAGVFVLGYVIGAARESPASADTLMSSRMADVDAEPREVLESSPSPTLFEAEPRPEADAREAVASTSQAASSILQRRPYKNLSRAWIEDYGRAIKAVRDPSFNPTGRELDEACLKVLEPMVHDGWLRIEVLKEAMRQAFRTFGEWKVSQGLIADLSQKNAGPSGRRVFESTSMKDRVRTTKSVFIDPGECAALDAAKRELDEARERYQREVREFIASCGG